MLQERAAVEQDVSTTTAEERIPVEYPADKEQLDQREQQENAPENLKQKRKGRKHRSSLDEGANGTLQTAH